MTQRRVFGQAKIMISLIVLFLLLGSTLLTTISYTETTEKSMKDEMELLPGMSQKGLFGSAKAPTGNAFFSATQNFPSLAQEAIVDGNDNIYMWALNYFSYDETATLGGHTIVYDDGGSSEGSYCYNSGMVGKMDSDGNWLWIAGIDCGYFNTGQDENADGQDDLYYGQEI